MWYLLGAKQNFWWQSPEKQRCQIQGLKYTCLKWMIGTDQVQWIDWLWHSHIIYMYSMFSLFLLVFFFFTISCSLSPPCSLVLCLFHILCFSSITFLPLPSSSIPPFFALFPCFSECRHGRCNSNMDTSCAWSVGFSFTSWAPVDIQHMFKS